MKSALKCQLYYICNKIVILFIYFSFMKKIMLALIVMTLLTSCKTEEKEQFSTDTNKALEKVNVDLTKYPESLREVFAAHGGLQNWSAMRSMTYVMDDQETITDLQTRDIVVKAPTHTIGSKDGKVWIAQDSTHFPEARARFYHNLMFYFYAMPFLLADDGIVYSDAASLEKDGLIYPGIKIGYEANIGDAPDDNYILYYHPKTKKMEWLAYTVTYGKEGKSDQYSYIKYNKWQEVNGLLLPEELTWYTVEEGKPVDARDEPRVFTRVDVDRAGLDTITFAIPDNGVDVD